MSKLTPLERPPSKLLTECAESTARARCPWSAPRARSRAPPAPVNAKASPSLSTYSTKLLLYASNSERALTRRFLPIFPDFYRFFRLSWETSAQTDLTSEASKHSGSGRIEFSSKRSRVHLGIYSVQKRGSWELLPLDPTGVSQKLPGALTSLRLSNLRT